MDVKRGFHRLGMVVLVPAWTFSVGAMIYAAWVWAVPGDHGMPWQEPAAAAFASFILSTAVYVGLWALGWIIRGFRGDR